MAYLTTLAVTLPGCRWTYPSTAVLNFKSSGFGGFAIAPVAVCMYFCSGVKTFGKNSSMITYIFLPEDKIHLDNVWVESWTKNSGHNPVVLIVGVDGWTSHRNHCISSSLNSLVSSENKLFLILPFPRAALSRSFAFSWFGTKPMLASSSTNWCFIWEIIWRVFWPR